jgi:hypothetical protein
MFCAPGLVFGVTEGVGSCFLVARPNSFSALPRASGLFFMFCALGLIFGGVVGVGSCFHVLLSRTRFQRYRGRRLPSSCFARPYSFSAEPRASGPVFKLCSPVLVFGGTEGDGYRFLILSTQTHFRRHRGRRVPFSCFALTKSFSAVPRASVPFSCFARPNSFSAVPRASGPVFMFCAPGPIFGGAEVVGSRFHVLRARTHYRQNRGRRVSFSCFALPNSFWAVPRASGPVFMFLSSRARFRWYRGRQVPFSWLALLESF